MFILVNECMSASEEAEEQETTVLMGNKVKTLAI